MSYVRRRALPPPRRARGLGDWLDDVIGAVTGTSAAITGAQQAACQGAMPDTSALVGLAAKIADVGTNWTPTGTFTPDDIFSIVGATTAMVRSAWNQVTAVQSNYDTSDLRDAESTFEKLGQQALDFTVAAQDAKAQGIYVNAPNIKQWVMDSMQATMDGMIAAAAGVCDQPAWAAGLATYTSAFNTVWSVVKGVAGVVLEVGQKALKIVTGGLDLIATVEKIAPYAAVGLAAWWLFLREKRRR